MLRRSACRLIAAYAIAQRYLPMSPWDQHWLDTTNFDSIGTGRNDHSVRVFGSLNSPGTLGALLLGSGCSATSVASSTARCAILGAVLIVVALSLTYVRAAQWALVIAALSHVDRLPRPQPASGGREHGGDRAGVARALPGERRGARRGESLRDDHEARRRPVRDRPLYELLQPRPEAVGTPQGHGLGTAGESTKLEGTSDLRFPDNGYLSLMYQVGPLGFLLVMAALVAVMRAAWNVAREPGPGQEICLSGYQCMVFIAFLLPSGDAFYGLSGVVLWYVGGSGARLRVPSTLGIHLDLGAGHAIRKLPRP